MLAAVRHAAILELLKQEKSVKVPLLSKKFLVTEETIRRDLEKLENDGLLKRIHGGAVRASFESVIEVSFEVRNMKNRKEKQVIGELAATMIQPGDVIIVDASSTALQIALEIKKRDLRDIILVTNGINVALELAAQTGINLICTGGMLRERSLSFVGPLAENALRSYHIGKAFISCKGVSVEAGLTEADELQARVKIEMIQAAREVYLLVDHEKFGRTAFAPVVPISKVHTLITDAGTPAQELDGFRNLGLQVLVAGGSDKEPE